MNFRLEGIHFYFSESLHKKYSKNEQIGAQELI